MSDFGILLLIIFVLTGITIFDLSIKLMYQK
jgi:hypothetical protein